MSRNRAAINRTSFGEKVVTGLAIAVLFAGFAAGGYASSMMDGQTGASFGTRTSSYRAIIHTHRTASRIIRHKSATMSVPSASLANYPLNIDVREVSIASPPANLAEESPDTLLRRDLAAHEFDRHEIWSAESPKIVQPLLQSLRPQKTRRCKDVLPSARHFLNCPKAARAVTEKYAKSRSPRHFSHRMVGPDRLRSTAIRASA